LDCFATHQVTLNKLAVGNDRQLFLKMILTSQLKFPLGQIVITPAALGKLASDEILNALDRHVQGDSWRAVNRFV
jgi:hypothetical protein